MQAERDYLVDKLQGVLHQSESYLDRMTQTVPREVSVKSLRKIAQFGNAYASPDFEWPKASDLLAMSAEKPIRLVGFNWKRCNSDKKCIAGVQVILNQATSPLFLARNSTNDHIERVNITSDQRVCKIKGQQGMNSNVSEIYFYDDQDNLITQMVAEVQGGCDTARLAEGEEIVGVYGTKNKLYDHFDTLGFIVWKP
jgi:hypothetical protein